MLSIVGISNVAQSASAAQLLGGGDLHAAMTFAARAERGSIVASVDPLGAAVATELGEGAGVGAAVGARVAASTRDTSGCVSVFGVPQPDRARTTTARLGSGA